ncbi:GNAT family N-acetyltransferase [Alteromonas sp. MTD1]|uniref:GNAT family N-acetyltransferase n=1 Tax=Alteromonas sp. MTD1 TaxID=3057962 RepID=UPI0036F41F33
MNYRIATFSQISQVSKSDWNHLAKDAGPFLQYDFLHALEQTGCCDSETGWEPCHVAIFSDDKMVGAIPGYLKTHSYGEYVFDHAWANAYHQHGLSYYPKWIAAIPFTPVTGARLLTHDKGLVTPALLNDISNTLQTHTNSTYDEALSSMHWLFTSQEQQALLTQDSTNLVRHAVQFQWHNYNYSQFDDFLGALTSRKRKDIKKLRRKHQEAGIHFSYHTGDDIQTDTLAFFLECYQATYLKRSGHTGYLNDAFFSSLHNTMRNNMLIVVAHQDQQPVASALFFYDTTGLYGRYWGALKEIDGLHFACCYFEGIEFAIANKLPLFNPGTQGEHKILRGFEPIYCYSNHQLFEPAFANAVAQFLQQETQHLANYFNQARNALPFNQEFVPLLKTTRVKHPNDDTHNHNEKNYEI